MIHKFTFLENILLRFNVIPHPVMDALAYVVAGRALQIGVKMRVFNILEDEPYTVPELAKKLKSSEEGMESLLGCLEALGYIQKSEEGKYSLTNRGQKFFSEESKSLMKNTILFSDYVFDSLSNLEKNIKFGGPKDVNLDIFTPRQWEIFNHTMVEIARTNKSEIASLVPASKSYEKLLDLGGSHALHAIEFCKKNPKLTAEVIDLKPVERYAKRIIKECKMEDRVKFRVGNFLKDDLGKGYDIILAFNIIHGLKSEVNRKLTGKVYRSLNPGGIYVILDQIKDARGNSELSKLISSAQGLMLFNVAGGRTYSFEEVSAWMKKSGFDRLKMKKLRAPGNVIILGYK